MSRQSASGQARSRWQAASGIAYGRIFHEANAYSPLSTTREDFERLHSLEGEALAARRPRSAARSSQATCRTPSSPASCRRRASPATSTTIPLASRMAVPGGPAHAECFEWLARATSLARIRAAGPLDGVYLALHGSMEVRDLGEAPEAVICAASARRSAPDAKIAVSYDLHANLSRGPGRAGRRARRVPHQPALGSRADGLSRGYAADSRAARRDPARARLAQAADGARRRRRPSTSSRRCAASSGCMRKLERDPRVRLGEPLHGAPVHRRPRTWAGPCTSRTDGDPELAERLADELADARVGRARCRAAAACSRSTRRSTRSCERAVAPARPRHARRRGRHRRRRRTWREHALRPSPRRATTAGSRRSSPCTIPALSSATWDVPLGTQR